MEVLPGSLFFFPISSTYTQLYEQIRLACFQRIKDCLLSALHPASLLWEKKNPGTLVYSKKILDDTPDLTCAYKPTRNLFMNPLPSALRKCHEYEGWISKSRWVSTVGCSASATQSLLSDTIQSPLQALRSESCYTAPLMDANLVLSPAAFFDELWRITDHDEGFVPISPAATAHLLKMLLQIPKPDNHCVKHLTAFWEWRADVLLVQASRTTWMGISQAKAQAKNMMPVPEGEHAKTQPWAGNYVGSVCPCQRAVWAFSPANSSAVSKKNNLASVFLTFES